MDTIKTPTLSPTVIVIFGITGDLSRRYLLPALYHLIKDGLLHPDTEIVGVSRRHVEPQDLLNQVELCVNDTDKTCDSAVLDKMRQSLRMFQMDLTEATAYHQLLSLLNDIEATKGMCMNRLYYLSIPPQVYGPIVRLMGQTGLNASCPHGVAMTRLLIEKPFGYDLASAQDLVSETAKVFGEEQIFRIDHYVAKETAQNILTFRFANPIFETLWNREHISRIEINSGEQITIEGRAQFYEPLGALRDFIQNHLLQLLAIVTMDKPTSMDSERIHASKQAVLAQVEAVPADHVAERALRWQYEGYRAEVSNPESTTETFAGIRVSIDNDRWRGIPIIIWTGKALAEKRTEIILTFDGQQTRPNQLRFRVQPNEGIGLDLLTKEPGFTAELQETSMDFSYRQNFEHQGIPNAYEYVLVDAVRGDHTLFATSQEVLEAWRIVEPVLNEWGKRADDLQIYPHGTDGRELARPLFV